MYYQSFKYSKQANGAMKELLKLSYDQPFMWDHMELVRNVNSGNLIFNLYNMIIMILFQKNMLISEMATTVPLINANGYFNVGKQLIPQVSSTLLYCILRSTLSMLGFSSFGYS